MHEIWSIIKTVKGETQGQAKVDSQRDKIRVGTDKKSSCDDVINLTPPTACQSKHYPKGDRTMSKNEIVSLIETMNNYDELASKAKAKADAIRDTLKSEMLRLDTEELNAGAYILRYTNIISNRFDTTTFKRLYADLYKDFTKAVSSRRFSVSC